MPTGHYQRKPRVERLRVKCNTCGETILVLPGDARRRKKWGGHDVKFCSQACFGKSIAKPSSKKQVECKTCGKIFMKRKDHLTKSNYCSAKCRQAGRRLPNSKWNDKKFISDYNRKYREANVAKVRKPSIKDMPSDKAELLREIGRERNRRYKLRHPDRITASNNNRRKFLKKEIVTELQWSKIKSLSNHSCLWCMKSEPEIKLTMDHIVPYSKGGRNVASNIQPLCVSCNSAKNSRTIDFRHAEWRKLFIAEHGSNWEHREF